MYTYDYFMKNPQTTIAPTFLTHIISAIDGVDCQGHLEGHEGRCGRLEGH